jgi:2-C-methyl-D-erythritol 4-phosphate cytidylyltransferase
MNKAVILAGGTGTRMNLGYNKVFAKLNGKPVLYYTIKNFELCPDVDSIVVTAGNPTDKTSENDISAVRDIVDEFGFNKISQIVAGGSSRMQSVEQGLLASTPLESDLVIIQDGGRPFTPPTLLSRMVAAAKVEGSAICGTTPKDTIQLVDPDGFSIKTFDRSTLLAIYTPLVSKWNLLGPARQRAKQEGYIDTPGFEDSAILQRNGVKVKVVPCDYTNIKITTPEDLALAETILARLS